MTSWLAAVLATALCACSGPAAPPGSEASAQPPPSASAGPSGAGPAEGWVDVRLEPNLSLRTRDGWNAARTGNGKGPIVFTGPHGARVVVWPVFIARAAKMPAPETLLLDFARRDGAKFEWSAPAALGKDGVRMFGKSGDAVAQASFVYSKTPVGVAGYWYLTEAPRSDYAALQPVFAGLLGGVRIYGAAEQPGAQPRLSFLAWQEPNEGAYVAQVPKDWRVTGGILRPDPLRILDPVEMTSPDGKVYAFSGDADLGVFKTLTQMERQLGLGEGSRNGAAVLMSYRPAVQLVPDYVSKRFGGSCQPLRIDVVQDQPDLAREVNLQLAAGTAPGTYQRVDVAFAAFHCGAGAVGLVQIATFITGMDSQYGTEGFGIWQISGVAGLVAPEARAGEAGEALVKFLTTRKVNKQWAQANQEMVAQINAISQKAAAELTAQINGRYAASSGSSVTSGDASGDDLVRRWQNSTMDQADVVDQATGQRYKVESGSNYYWINQQGTAIVGTNAPAQPSIDYTAMIQLP